MGEAKRRAAAGGDHAAIEAMLRSHGVDTSQFGFYDQPAFLDQERRDPAFLENYARWVMSRPRDSRYDERVRAVVPKLATFVAELFQANDMQRSCVHASSMLPPILGRLGIWSFGLKGSMTMAVPSLDIWRGQAMCDFPDFPGAELGHAWVCAPPFVLVDPTLGLQNPEGDPIGRHVPLTLAIENSDIVSPTVDDVVSQQMQASAAAREGRLDPQLHHRLVPALKKFGREFPSREIRIGTLVLRYVPAGVRLADTKLEDINSAGERLSGAEVWEDHVAPAFAEFRMDAA